MHTQIHIIVLLLLLTDATDASNYDEVPVSLPLSLPSLLMLLFLQLLVEGG